MNVQWIEEVSWLGQQPDERVVRLQGQINTLLGQIPGSVPIQVTGVIDSATCNALAGLIASMDTLRWAVQFSATQVNPAIAPADVFAEAVALCSKWPPRDTPPPRLFPHTHQVKSGETLESIALGEKGSRNAWQQLRDANPFLSGISGGDVVLSRMPQFNDSIWLPRGWPLPFDGQPGRPAPLPTSVGTPIIPGVPPITVLENIPRLGFPLPAIPGASPELVLTAINHLTRAGVACPQLAAPGSALQHAATAFSIFAGVSVAMGSSGQENLDMLDEQLTSMCPAWQTTEADQPLPGGGTVPPTALGPALLLAKVVQVLQGGPSMWAELPPLADNARSAGLPSLAGNIMQFSEAKGLVEPAEPPGMPPTGLEPPAKKKGISGLALAALAIVGIGIAVVVARS